MRGKTPTKRKGPFAQWLFGQRKARGLIMTALAEKAGVSHPRIVQLEQGDTTTRDMVQRLARALVPADLDTAEAEEAYRRILNEGLRAAGFASRDEPEINYGSNPDTARIAEAYENAPESIRRAFEALADTVQSSPVRKSAAEIADEMDREESIGKRA